MSQGSRESRRATSVGRHPHRAKSFIPSDVGWRDVWLVATPVWAMLTVSRVLFYALERLRFPELIPPVSADAIQGVLLWPACVLGCYCTLRIWARAGTLAASAAAVLTALVVGAISRPAYAVGWWLSDAAAARAWLQSFSAPVEPVFWYAWLSNAVEYAVLYLSSLAATMAFLGWRAVLDERLLRARVEAAAAQERLRALRAQLNPHFLFNALNSIVSMSDTERGGAQHLLTQLSELLRRTLRASECEQHELGEELAYAEAYLRIQQVRQPLRIRWQVLVNPPDLRVYVPSLILLPLIENAVTHGLRSACSVNVEIEAVRRPGKLLLRVRNTCAARAAADASSGSSLGLRNVSERLQVLFGPRASLSAARIAPDRFEARIVLPEQAAPTELDLTEDLRCEH